MEFLIVALLFLTIIWMNILIVQLIVRKTTNKKIIPQLKEFGFEIVQIKKVGFLNTGDFN